MLGASKASGAGASDRQAEEPKPPRETRRTRKARARGQLSPQGQLEDGMSPGYMAGGDAAGVEPPPGLPRFNRENDDGNIEYKLRLKQPTPFRFQQLVRA